ncbi:MAG TPA: DUF4382 domain-containing protein [Chitinophagaceae bacterium]|jgi:hypothetical protein
MKTKTTWLAAGAGSLIACMLFFACKKDNSASSNIPSGKAQMSIVMMDAPISFYKVLIDIKQVAVLIDTAAGHNDPDLPHEWDNDYRGCHNSNTLIWDTLSVTPGVYDLLQLRNGTDTLLASGLITNGKVLKVRITLGTRDSVYTDSVTHYPLNIAWTTTFFDINIIHGNIADISNNQFKLWLDFNLARSVVFWNGAYWLYPEVVAFNDNALSKVQGRVLPAGASPFVMVYNASDTLYALPNWEGYYQVRGAAAGTYSIYFKGQHGYQDTTISNIVVTAGKLVTAPTVTLHK